MTQQMKRGLLAVLLGAILSCTQFTQAGVVVEMNAVGDDTQFYAWALAASAAAGTGAGNWTVNGNPAGGSFYASLHDVRLSTIPLEKGSLWVIWNSSMTKVWCYLATDTIVATRGFFAVPRAQLMLNPLVMTKPGMNLVTVLPPDDPFGLPTPIYTAINNLPWNAIMTANLPNVNWTESQKMLAVPPTPPARYGYGPAPITLEIKATLTANYRTPVAFNITGTDPITGGAIPPYAAQSLPPSLVVPIVNATNTVPPGGIGSFITASHNVTEPCGTLSNGLKGVATTTQLFGLTSAGNVLNVFLDDPLDGPWWITESELYIGCAGTKSQEAGVLPPANDPVNISNPGISLRRRVLGQAGVVVMATPDSLGYVAWTCNRMAGHATYVTVNGEEPFSLPWTTTLGVFPACGTATVSLPWPLFTKQLVMTDTPVPPGVGALVNPVKAIVTPGDVWP